MSFISQEYLIMNQENNNHKVCTYDGITLFTQDKGCIAHILKNSEKYKLQGSYDITTNQTLWKFSGKYKNFTISAVTNSKGNGIRLGGSLHKWKNQVHNYDTFKWGEFLKAYYEIINEFRLDPCNTVIWSLESGLNNPLPNHLKYKARDIPENTLLLNGDPKKSSRSKYAHDGYGLENQRGECKQKLYDKGVQFSVGYEILRTECSCKRRPLAKHGLITLEDLIDYDKHLLYGNYLIKTFETLLLFQPEILLNPSLSDIDRLFLLEFNNTISWNKLRKKSDYQFKKARKRFLSLIDQHCEINYRSEILNLMNSQLH